ncbi:MAG: hypothetical protein F6K41_30170 [Symploca sp. SIO3E6]|nr:hypothetical protein [Caldora sp. SIO3E6]
MNKLMLGLLAFSTLGFISLPASADQVTVQTSEQFAAQQGHGNLSIQHVEQQSTNNNWGNNSSQGSVQNNRQEAFQEGDGSVNFQEKKQEIRQNYQR